MEPQQRARRPEPERTWPIRNWWMLFGPAWADASRARPSQGASPGEPVSQGVELGYRVIEEYLRQGQNVARSLWAPSLGAAPGDEGMQQRLGAMFRSFSDFAVQWMELLGSLGGGAFPGTRPQPAPSGGAGPFPAGNPPAPEAPAQAAPGADTVGKDAPAAETGAGGLAFTLEVESKRQTEVSIDLRPGSASLPLRVHDLRSADPDRPRIGGVVIEGRPEEGRVLLRLRIPDEVPPGTYSGVILDERTSLPRGTLSVRLLSS